VPGSLVRLAEMGRLRKTPGAVRVMQTGRVQPEGVGRFAMDDKGLSRLLRVREAGADRPGWRCPDAARLAAYVEHRAGSTDEARIEAHLADCSACLEQVAFLLRRPGPETSTVPPEMLARARDLVASRPSVWRAPVLRWGTAVAAAACVVLVVSLQLRQPVVPPVPGPPPVAQPSVVQAPSAGSTTALVAPDVPRAAAVAPPPGSPTTTVRRSTAAAALEVTSPAENATLSPRDLEFRWQAVPGSVYYELSLVTEDGDVVWQDRVEGTFARLPEGVALRTGAKYFVWVHAYLAAGVTLKSAAVPFRVGTR
jgi:Putative zinc-finger